MRENLKVLLSKSIAQITGLKDDDIISSLEKPKKVEHGDLAYPCFSLAKIAKSSPSAFAADLANKIALPKGFLKVQSVGPFLNFFFDRPQFSASVVNEIISKPLEKLLKTKKQIVLIEYSSPNIAKPFHVGHMRTTLIGNSLERIYRFIGHRVVSINYLGDWGTQFGFVWAGCEIWGRPAKPSVKSLVELYRKSTAVKEAQETGSVPPELEGLPDVNEMARKYFLDLEGGEKYAVDFWKWCLEISLTYFKDSYARLGVNFDVYTGESAASDLLEKTRITLDNAGLLTESQGALGIDLGEELGFARVYTPDGRSLYLARDIATIKERADAYNFDQMLYVVGAPQSLHFQQLIEIAKKLNWAFANKIIHVAYGHVLGMKTRGEGEFIELNEFLDEAKERALRAYHEQVKKRPEGLDEQVVANAVGLSAVIFSTLSRARNRDVHFDWNNALEFTGDSGPYLLYAAARIVGIAEKAKGIGVSPKGSVAAETLNEDSAYLLASILSDFTEVIQRSAAEYEPSVIANYAIDVAQAISRAYQDLKVIDEENKEKAQARLSLFVASGKVLRQCLSLLGITPLERM